MGFDIGKTESNQLENGVFSWAKMTETFNKKLKKYETKLADLITQLSGSMFFVYLHVAWFGLWFVFFPHQIELLTLVVSLEAIFLSTFILVSQNRERELAIERELEEDKEDEETQEDLEGIEQDIEEIQEDVDVVHQDLDEIKKLILKIEDRLNNPTSTK